MQGRNPKKFPKGALPAVGGIGASQSQLKQLIESSPLAMIVSSGRDEHVELVNSKFTEIFGYTLEDMPDVAHWWPLAYPDEKYREEIKGRWQERVETAIKTKSQIEPMEATVRCKDGSYRYVEFRLSSIRDWHLVTFVDLTERKQAEEKLRKSAEEIQDLYDHAPCGYHSLDNQGLIIRINDTELQWLGYTRDEVVGKMNLTDLIAEKSLQTFQEKFQLFKQQGRINNLEFEMIRKDGTLFSVLLSATAIYDEAGKFLMSRSTLFDITERRRTENALHESENRFRVLSENAFVGIYIIQDGRLSYVNSTLAKMFGYTSEELTGAQPALVIHPDDQALVSENIRRRIDGEIETIHYEFRGRCKDGEIRNIEVLGGRVDFGGKASIIGNLMDITERKRAEEALRESEARLGEAARIAHVGYWDRDYIAETITLSDEACQIFGISSQYRFFNLAEWHEQWVRLIHPEDQPKVTQILKEALAGGPPYKADYRVIRPDGSIRHIHSYANLTRGESGNPVRMFGTMIDITERKQMEEALTAREREFRTLAENSPDNIARYDTNCQTIYVNPALMKTLSRTAPEMLGTFPKEAGFIAEAKEYQNKMREVLKTGKEAELDIVMPDTGEGKRYHNIRFVAERGVDGAIAGVQAIGRDITERKQIEDALRKNNALLERIFSSTEFLIAYMDTDFNFIRVNRAYAKADGKTPEYFVGKNHFTLYPNKENEKIFRNVLATGETFVVYAKPFVYENHPEWGTTYWNWTLQPVKEADGSITGLVISLVDVTARERAIIARHESDERYRTLVQQASDGIFVADPQGNYIDANPSGCVMLGFTREELLQLNMRDLASPRSQDEKPLRMDLLQDGKSITLERTLITRDGTALPVEISGTVLENGNLLGIVRNITERKRHELEREAVITVSASLRQASTRTEIINIILDKLLELFGADGTVMVLPDPLTKGYIDEMGRGTVGERMIGLNVPPGKGVCNWVIENKKPYRNNQAQNDPLFYRPDLLGDSHCLATVPLITNEQVIGALWIARKKEITDADLSLLNAIADIAANAIHRVILHEQTQRQLQHLIALHQIDLAITTNFDLNVTLDIILNNVKNELDVDAAAILLLDPVTHTLGHTASMGFKTPTIERSRVKLADGCAGLAVREQRIVSHPNLKLVHGSFSRSSLLLDENFTAYFAAPLISKGQVKGVLEVFKNDPYEPDAEWLSYFETLATQAAIAIESVNMFNNLQRSNSELTLAYDATIEGWSLALDLRDKETEGHSQRVTEMTLQLAEKIGMADVEKLNLKRGALLHDIGKMGIPDSILLKTGTLTLDEIKIMQQHPIYAHQMLSPITYLKHAVEIPYCHHEKWDGSGYPRGLKGEEIPLSARLFAVVDVFDALSSDRPYRKAWPREETLRYIEEQAGKHFDPKIANIFLKMIKDRS